MKFFCSIMQRTLIIEVIRLGTGYYKIVSWSHLSVSVKLVGSKRSIVNSVFSTYLCQTLPDSLEQGIGT